MVEADREERQAFMNIQDVILGILNEKPHSGYEIKRHFEEYFSFFFDASFGTIYPTLSKMEGLHLITKESVRQEGKPDKNVYTITAAGTERFLDYMQTPAENDVLRSDFLMHTYFGNMADEATMQAQLRKGMEMKQQLYDDLENKLHQLRDQGKLTPYQILCMELGLVQYDAFIRKIQSVLDSE